ncbi:putative GMP synthase [Daphnia magna]|uniref:Putative GMP synthase n=1 Tax=Daphnia magna TaxID=35525 RepID=A0A164YCN0_9CRUS|nr:putative GMP synthase [Daphnia magna]
MYRIHDVVSPCSCWASISITVSCLKTNLSRASLVYSNSGVILRIVKASLHFYDVSTDVHGCQASTLCRSVNP